MNDYERLIQALLANLLAEAEANPAFFEHAGVDAGVPFEDLVHPDGGEIGIKSYLTFDDHGVLTRDAGIVLQLTDGAEFQITIVQSRHPNS